MGDVEDEVHDTVFDVAPVLAVGVPEIPEDVMDEAPSEDEVDEASSAVWIFLMLRRRRLWRWIGSHLLVSVSVCTLQASRLSDEECYQVSRGPVPFGVAVGSAGDSSNRFGAPRMLLFRRPRGGSISREKLTDRFAKFAGGEWTELSAWSHACAEEAAVASRGRQRRPEDQEELRAARALALVQLGELSSARQSLEGAELAPANAHTLQELQ